MNSAQQQAMTLTINGRETVWDGDPSASLADVLREGQGLTGTKIGCRTGECGACTVLMDGRPVVSCLVPAGSAQGERIETIEGLAERADYQALVQAMLEHGGVQCGFCTPGVMVTTYAWMQQPERFDGDLGAALKNNLCRCTGYLGILRAAEQALAAGGGAR
ncbi:(2Fe-2S)-binding protein [Paenibacillus sp. IB182496]|uniref:(2Fe-2S)-binding protein n=1 Tax=Paenibacillus sabuli TaxID=2772509 RepID=A0A927BND4_9BACL|nr:(2Fe-2S)-binding protein [Paenibacillus sabuli]MBD2843732.1 (2Fe-2S)-binding protein [Paenibacillus sabuli]